MNPSPPRRFLRSLATLATDVAGRLEKSLLAGCDRLADARASLQAALGRDIPAAECADMLGQAMVASLPLVAGRKEVFKIAAAWLLQGAKPWERLVLEEIFDTANPSVLRTEYSVLSTQYSVPSHPRPHLYEHFLTEHRRLHRKRGGVFYTPEEIVRFICRCVDQQLQEEFRLPQGLAETTILDPAAGSGAFLLGAIDQIHSRFDSASDWNRYVSENLLPRLLGIEIIPAACLAAQLCLAIKLADTGFRFEQPGRIRVELGNTLADGADLRFETSDLRRAPLVLLGNPPFSSLSDNRGSWITDLVRGSKERSGYVVTADERLGERKTWLHDDYVKFIRYAQWLVEEAGSGIVGLVTNHGFLDNITFRLMRRELLRTFSRIDIVDLHGNRKKGETAPHGQPDENVFGLDQGVAICFLRRLPAQSPSRERVVRHTELWGSREDKLCRLSVDDTILPEVAFPSSPNYLFTPAPRDTPRDYASAWRLPDAMPVNTTAPVTARDHFVIAKSREELCRRIVEFRDLSIPDDVIRSRYFTRTRSAKYPPGDTRSWKLGAARQIIAAEANWESFIRRCLYRPYDWRYVFWHPAMIDWPRAAVTDRLQISGAESEIPNPKSQFPNLQSLLLSRRQMLPTQPCTFFWVADTLPIDGVIRSDNRGSESLFPLYLKGGETHSGALAANFAADFVAAFANQFQLAWLTHGSGDLDSTFGPEDLLHYIYSLFHSPTYRQRYAAELRRDFPRILLPQGRSLFRDLVPRGQRLIEWHTLRAPAPDMNGVTADKLLEFRAGGHQLLRPSRIQSAAALDHPLAPYVAATLAEMSAIDEAIQEYGGFPAAFLS